MWGELRKIGHFHDLCVDGRIILKWTFEQCGGLEWIDMAEGGDRWRAVVNAVMKVLFL